MRKAGILATVVVFGAVTACGGGGGGKTVDAEKYGEDVCDAFTEWREGATKELDEAFDTVDDGDPDEARDRVVDAVAASVEATDQLVESVDDAGQPDVDDGEELAETVEKLASDLRETIQSAREDAEDLPTNDDFEDAAQDLRSELGEDIQSLTGALEDDLSPEQQEVFEGTECEFGQDASDFAEAAERAIEGFDPDVQDIECEDPDSQDDGTEFTCTATIDGEEVEFLATIDGDRVNVLPPDDLPDGSDETTAPTLPVVTTTQAPETTDAPETTEETPSETTADEENTAEDFQEAAEEAILDGFEGSEVEDVECELPDSTEVDTTFACTAVIDDEDAAFEAVIDSEDRVTVIPVQTGGPDVVDTETFAFDFVPVQFEFSSEYGIDSATESATVVIGPEAEIEVFSNGEPQPGDFADDIDDLVEGLKADYEDSGMTVSEISVEEHNGMELHTLHYSGSTFEGDSYYFLSLDELWEIECISDFESVDEVREACDLALETLAPVGRGCKVSVRRIDTDLRSRGTAPDEGFRPGDPEDLFHCYSDSNTNIDLGASPDVLSSPEVGTYSLDVSDADVLITGLGDGPTRWAIPEAGTLTIESVVNGVVSGRFAVSLVDSIDSEPGELTGVFQLTVE